MHVQLEKPRSKQLGFACAHRKVLVAQTHQYLRSNTLHMVSLWEIKLLYILVVAMVFKQEQTIHIGGKPGFSKQNTVKSIYVRKYWIFLRNIHTLYRFINRFSLQNMLMNSPALCWYSFKTACILRKSVDRYFQKFWEDGVYGVTSFSFTTFDM